MRSIWNGAITFGLISIPVRLFAAVDEKDVSFRQLHAKDNGRIRYKRICEVCDEEVPYEEIVRGYEYEKDRYVIFTEDELQRIPADIRAVDIVSFVPLQEIDPIYFQKPYYLAPEPTGLKAYRLLERAMEDAGRVGLAKVAIRDKEHLATLRIKGEVMVLETMHWPDEIREPQFDVLDKKVELRKQEIEMAKSLVENLTDSFRPEEFHDEYRERLEAAAQAKIEGEEIAIPPTREPTKVADLMEALRASVEATKKAEEKGPVKAKAKAKSA